jgi:hypothetical protein
MTKNLEKKMTNFPTKSKENVAFLTGRFYTRRFGWRFLSHLWYLSAHFTVINATQLSKFEREGSSSKYPLPTRGFFLFPSSFPTNDKEDCFVLTCACHSYLYSNKDKQKLETGSS